MTTTDVPFDTLIMAGAIGAFITILAVALFLAAIIIAAIKMDESPPGVYETLKKTYPSPPRKAAKTSTVTHDFTERN